MKNLSKKFFCIFCASLLMMSITSSNVIDEMQTDDCVEVGFDAGEAALDAGFSVSFATCYQNAWYAICEGYYVNTNSCLESNAITDFMLWLMP